MWVGWWGAGAGTPLVELRVLKCPFRVFQCIVGMPSIGLKSIEISVLGFIKILLHPFN